MMLIVMPYQVGPRTAWLLRGQASRSVVWFREVPGSHAVWCVILRVSFRQVPPSFPARSGGAIPGTGHPTLVIPLLVELVVSRLLGHNWWPRVPGVQDPDSSP
jgi:hypothetical protein